MSDKLPTGSNAEKLYLLLKTVSPFPDDNIDNRDTVGVIGDDGKYGYDEEGVRVMCEVLKVGFVFDKTGMRLRFAFNWKR